MQPTDEHNGPVHQTEPGLPRKKSWWGRNWFWVLPVGCLTPILFCGGFFTLIISLVFGMIKSSYPYEDSLATVQSDQRVVSVLGSPVEPGFFVTGQINLNNNSGNADIAYSISGPNGEGDVYVTAVKTAGQWSYTLFEVYLDPTSQNIDMLAKP